MFSHENLNTFSPFALTNPHVASLSQAVPRGEGIKYALFWGLLKECHLHLLVWQAPDTQNKKQTHVVVVFVAAVVSLSIFYFWSNCFIVARHRNVWPWQAWHPNALWKEARAICKSLWHLQHWNDEATLPNGSKPVRLPICWSQPCLRWLKQAPRRLENKWLRRSEPIYPDSFALSISSNY